MKSRILFITFPGAMDYTPFMAFSVLKTFLKSHDIESKIVYFNLYFNRINSFYNAQEPIISSLLPCIYFFAKQMNNKEALNRIETYLYSLISHKRFRIDYNVLNEIDNVFKKQKKCLIKILKPLNKL